MPSSEPHLSTSFAADVRLLAGVRDFARDAARQLGAEVDQDLLAIVVGELAANAAVHQEGDALLDLTRRDGALEISVSDPDPAMPWVDHSEPANLQGHRGMRMVEALTEDWGVEQTADGKRVWALLPAVESEATLGRRCGAAS